jgi:hypothetical protein
MDAPTPSTLGAKRLRRRLLYASAGAAALTAEA